VASSPIASLVVDPVSHNTILKAGNTTGTVYIKYLIGENKYSYGTNQIYSTNNDLTSTAIIKVNVSPTINN